MCPSRAPSVGSRAVNSGPLTDGLRSSSRAQCPDGNGVVGTNRSTLFNTAQALVPDLEWPPPRYEVPETQVALDWWTLWLSGVAKPVRGPYHSFYRH
jgi:hypothetical protein